MKEVSSPLARHFVSSTNMLSWLQRKSHYKVGTLAKMSTLGAFESVCVTTRTIFPSRWSGSHSKGLCRLPYWWHLLWPSLFHSIMLYSAHTTADTEFPGQGCVSPAQSSLLLLFHARQVLTILHLADRQEAKHTAGSQQISRLDEISQLSSYRSPAFPQWEDPHLHQTSIGASGISHVLDQFPYNENIICQVDMGIDPEVHSQVCWNPWTTLVACVASWWGKEDSYQCQWPLVSQRMPLTSKLIFCISQCWEMLFFLVAVITSTHPQDRSGTAAHRIWWRCS